MLKHKPKSCLLTSLETINKSFKRLFSLTLLLLAGLVFANTQPFSSKTIELLTINGPIGPATSEYISQGIKNALNKNAQAIVIEMDTPGGLDKSMRSIIKNILSSPIPIITYVAPAGARAASAGTYILYASHIAAMAPGTNLGAATPVQIIGASPKNKKSDDKKQSSENPSALKVQNDAIAYIESLAKLRNRNEAWAKKAITEAASLPADKALKLNVIELVSPSLTDLLKAINGKVITINNQKIQLNTQNATIERYNPDWRIKLLSVITSPSIAYILLLIGIYGLFFEFANPGFIVPGVTGAIALILALYAFHLLPINYAGMGLILLGLAFLCAEAFMPSFGILGLGGIIAFVTGSVFLMQTELKAFQIDWSIIITMALLNAAFFLGIIGMVIRASQRKVVSGKENLIGMQGRALEDFEKEGWVFINGERWHAKSQTPIAKDDLIEVNKVEGLTLYIEKARKT